MIYDLAASKKLSLDIRTFHNPCKNKKGRPEICSDPALNTEKQKAPSMD
jgi:hypothetical protein